MSQTREERLKQIPSSMRGTYQKNQTSRAAAIKSFCQECTVYNREHIKFCTALACPLYTFRPYQSESEADDSVPEEGATP